MRCPYLFSISISMFLSCSLVIHHPPFFLTAFLTLSSPSSTPSTPFTQSTPSFLHHLHLLHLPRPRQEHGSNLYHIDSSASRPSQRLFCIVRNLKKFRSEKKNAPAKRRHLNKYVGLKKKRLTKRIDTSELKPSEIAMLNVSIAPQQTKVPIPGPQLKSPFGTKIELLRCHKPIQMSLTKARLKVDWQKQTVMQNLTNLNSIWQIISTIKKNEVDGKKYLTEEEVINLLIKLKNKCSLSAEDYHRKGKIVQASEQLAVVQTCLHYLPKPQYSLEQVMSIIDSVVRKWCARSSDSMGIALRELNKQLATHADITNLTSLVETSWKRNGNASSTPLPQTSSHGHGRQNKQQKKEAGVTITFE